MSIDKSNHGQVGEALYIKMTLLEFNKQTSNNTFFTDKTILSVDELNNGNYGVFAGIPIHIDNETNGDYEVVCENGTEIHEWND